MPWNKRPRKNCQSKHLLDLICGFDKGRHSELSSSIIEDDTIYALALIASGIDVNLDIRYGRTALHYACEYSNFKVVEALIEAKADLNPNSAINSPLAMACTYGPSNIPFTLLAHGCEYEYYRGPLLQSIKYKAQKAIHLLDDVRTLFLGCKWPESLIEKLIEFLLHEKNMRRVVDAFKCSKEFNH